MKFRTLLVAASLALALFFAPANAPAQTRTFVTLPSVLTYYGSTYYNVGDLVTSSSVTYISLVANNHGNTPASSPSDWAAIGGGGSGIPTTPVGAVVQINGGSGAANSASNPAQTFYVQNPSPAEGQLPPAATITSNCAGLGTNAGNTGTLGQGWTGCSGLSFQSVFAQPGIDDNMVGFTQKPADGDTVDLGYWYENVFGGNLDASFEGAISLATSLHQDGFISGALATGAGSQPSNITITSPHCTGFCQEAHLGNYFNPDGIALDAQTAGSTLTLTGFGRANNSMYYTVTGYSGASSSAYGNIVQSTCTGAGAWSGSTSYSTTQWVTAGGGGYVSVVNSNLNVNPSPNGVGNSQWSATVNYGVGAVVFYAPPGDSSIGNMWVSNSANNLGNNPNTSSAWTLYWVPVGFYQQPMTTTCNVALASESGNFSTTGHAAIAGPSQDEVVVTAYGSPSSSTGAPAYSGVTAYRMGDAVVASGQVYVSLVNSNYGNTPSSSPSDWQSTSTQSVTFITRRTWDNSNGNDDPALIMQGGPVGQALVASGTIHNPIQSTDWPVSYQVLGYVGGKLFFDNCLGGSCTGLNSNNFIPVAITANIPNGGTLSCSAGTTQLALNSPVYQGILAFFPVGKGVTISGAGVSGYNGTYTVLTNTTDLYNPVITWAQTCPGSSTTTFTLSQPNPQAVLYPMAFEIGTNNGTQNSVQLGTNSLTTAANDLIVAAPSSQVAVTGVRNRVGVTTPNQYTTGYQVINDGPQPTAYDLDIENPPGGNPTWTNPQSILIDGSYQNYFDLGYRPAYGGDIIYVNGGDPIAGATGVPYGLFHDHQTGQGFTIDPTNGNLAIDDNRLYIGTLKSNIWLEYTAPGGVRTLNLNGGAINIPGTTTPLEFNGDTGLSRDSAGVVDVGNGTAADKSGSMKMTNLTVTGTCTGCGSGIPSQTPTFTPYTGGTAACATGFHCSSLGGTILITAPGGGIPAGGFVTISWPTAIVGNFSCIATEDFAINTGVITQHYIGVYTLTSTSVIIDGQVALAGTYAVGISYQCFAN